MIDLNITWLTAHFTPPFCRELTKRAGICFVWLCRATRLSCRNSDVTSLSRIGLW